MRKVAPIHGLRHKRAIPSWWNDVMFVMHAFDHSKYNTYTNPRWKAPAAKGPAKNKPAPAPSAASTANPVKSASSAEHKPAQAATSH